jgi:hypothetical protein
MVAILNARVYTQKALFEKEKNIRQLRGKISREASRVNERHKFSARHATFFKTT